MKLRVNYIDMWSLQCNMINLNQTSAPNRRMVEIELTPEQAELLKCKKVGMSGKTEMHDEVEAIYIIDDDISRPPYGSGKRG